VNTDWGGKQQEKDGLKDQKQLSLIYRYRQNVMRNVGQIEGDCSTKQEQKDIFAI